MAFYEFRDIRIMGIAVAIPRNTIPLEAVMPALGRETVERFRDKAGIDYLHIAIKSQTASDLGFVASDELLRVNKINKSDIGFVIFISRTPDYRSPATATVLHYRLDLSQDCIAFDINMGGAGFFYGLQIGCSLLGSTNKGLGLIIMGDTSSKEVSSSDPAFLMLGDCASAVILEKTPGSGQLYVQTGSDGGKLRSFYIPSGGFRMLNKKNELLIQNSDFLRTRDNLFIDWSEFMSFAKEEMDNYINDFLKKFNRSLKDFNICVYAGLDHQGAESYQETHKADQIIAPFVTSNSIYYNGSTIPYYLVDNFNGKSDVELHVLGVGYGEGLSWGLTDFFVNTRNLLPLIETDEVFHEGDISHDL